MSAVALAVSTVAAADAAASQPALPGLLAPQAPLFAAALRRAAATYERLDTLPLTHEEPSAGLVASVAAQGILDPVILTASGAVKAGARRLAAARKAELPGDTLVPVRRLATDDARTGAVVALASNWYRDENVAAEARELRGLADAGYSAERIAGDLHVTPARVRNLLALTTLPGGLWPAVERGAIRGSVAMRLVKLSPSQLARLAETLTATGTVTPADVLAVQRATRKDAQDGLDAALFGGPDADALRAMPATPATATAAAEPTAGEGFTLSDAEAAAVARALLGTPGAKAPLLAALGDRAGRALLDRFRAVADADLAAA